MKLINTIGYALLLMLLVCNCNKKISNPESEGKNTGGSNNMEIKGNSNIDVSQEIQKIVDEQGNNVTLNFEANKTYHFSDISFRNKTNVKIIGNGATIKPSDGRSFEEMLFFYNVKNLQISNLKIDGNYTKSNATNHLIQIQTLISEHANQIEINDVHIKDASNGGINIQNYNSEEKIKAFGVGAKSIHVSNCSFINFGKKSALRVRGAHENVLMENCFASDSLGRQEKGKIFACTSEVNPKRKDAAKKVVIRNCKIRYNQKAAVFLQCVEDATIDNIEMIHIGKDKDGNISITNGIKIDNLGIGNKALISNCTARESGIHPSSSFIAIEQGKINVTENVTIRNCETDMKMRITGKGSHIIENNLFHNAAIYLWSDNSKVIKNTFNNSKSMRAIYVGGENSLIEECDLNNGTIEIKPNAVGAKIRESKFTGNQKNCIIIKNMDENKKKSLIIEDNTVPKNSKLLHISAKKKNG